MASDGCNSPVWTTTTPAVVHTSDIHTAMAWTTTAWTTAVPSLTLQSALLLFTLFSRLPVSRNVISIVNWKTKKPNNSFYSFSFTHYKWNNWSNFFVGGTQGRRLTWNGCSTHPPSTQHRSFKFFLKDVRMSRTLSMPNSALGYCLDKAQV